MLHGIYYNGCATKYNLIKDLFTFGTQPMNMRSVICRFVIHYNRIIVRRTSACLRGSKEFTDLTEDFRRKLRMKDFKMT